MTPNSDAPRARPKDEDRARRLIGAYRGDEPGPLFLCISSLHGNEPAGIEALKLVIGSLIERKCEIRGDIVGLRGNLSALELGERFVDEDLNRVWQRDRVVAILQSLRADGPAPTEPLLPMVGSVELGEQRELLAAIREEVQRARGPVIVIDLHTTSADSAPFTTLGDTLQNRALATQLPIPVVLGLEERIDGAMLQYFDQLGWRSIGIEGGAHRAPESVSAHEDVLWLLFAATGVIPEVRIPDLPIRWERLSESARGLPRVVDIRYRHEVSEGDGFRMKPGFKNFDRARRGDEMGTDAKGVVVAPAAGRIFLPLYQSKGDDGFFIVRRLDPAWLRISKSLRQARADRLAGWLPGVRVHPDRSDAVVLSALARNRVVMGLLHLLGYNAYQESGRLLMVRRRETPTLDPDLDLRI